MAYISCAQFMSFPLIENTEHLPLASWYPFDHTKSPLYEVLYIWQWFMNQVVITTLSGFDVFFNAIVMVCSTQFQVLQDVLENLCLGKGRKQWDYMEIKSESRIVHENEAIVVCVKQHLKMISVCEMVESTFAHIVFIQFIVSTLAICVSCVSLIADPTQFQHMLSYCVAHLLQFFIYCSVGNELTFQSGLVAESAYNCDWERNTNNLFLMRSLAMIIQRAQRPETLTVGGLMQLSFANFMGSIQLSFSFYTLLNSYV
ncbi:PREDICTED: odorant receptor 4-like [Nicrophorus vespilloides]|uniref:Odorant receptor 4-like n=1 Tax=Nicrophorus vespilloides TaxID=110193 RepID=A0ABM1MRT1_NICVS|nr:PREDICTED: odorant receptor 4-like [Nicrophorus vespilloides]